MEKAPVFEYFMSRHEFLKVDSFSGAMRGMR
jgi:hypothetical protein